MRGFFFSLQLPVLAWYRIVIYFRTDRSRFLVFHWPAQETRDNFNNLNHRDENTTVIFFGSKLLSPGSPELCNYDFKVLEGPFTGWWNAIFCKWSRSSSVWTDFHEVSWLNIWRLYLHRNYNFRSPINKLTQLSLLWNSDRLKHGSQNEELFLL